MTSHIRLRRRRRALPDACVSLTCTPFARAPRPSPQILHLTQPGRQSTKVVRVKMFVPGRGIGTRTRILARHFSDSFFGWDGFPFPVFIALYCFFFLLNFPFFFTCTCLSAELEPLSHPDPAPRPDCQIAFGLIVVAFVVAVVWICFYEF